MFGVDQSKRTALVFQAHFFVEVGQGGFGPLGVLVAPVHEQTHADAAKHAQDPRGVAMAYAAAILIGADIQPLLARTSLKLAKTCVLKRG